MEQFVTAANEIMWSLPMVLGLLALGVYFTVRMGAPQLRLIRQMIGQLVSGGTSSAGISSFQMFVMPLAGPAAAVGTQRDSCSRARRHGTTSRRRARGNGTPQPHHSKESRPRTTVRTANMVEGDLKA